MRSASLRGTTGFLKKLPALPSTAGSGNLLRRIWITASLMSWTVGSVIPRLGQQLRMAP